MHHCPSLGTLDRGPHLGNQDLDLVETPAQDLAYRVDDQPIETEIQRRRAVRANLLETFVSRPRTHWHTVYPMRYVRKAGLGTPLCHLIRESKGAPRDVAGVVEDLGPLFEDVILTNLDGRILGLHLDVGLHVLEPPAGLQRGVHLPVQLGPVADGAVQGAHVDEVEGVGLEGPVELGVFDLEAQVWGDPVGLGGCDVDADDFGGWVFVSDVSAF